MTQPTSHEVLFTEVEKFLAIDDPLSINKAYCLHKTMVKNYAKSAISKGYCYDHVNLERLFAQIYMFPLDYRPGLLKHLRRILSLNCIEFDKKSLDKKIMRVELTKEFRKKRLSSKLLLGLLSYNAITVSCLLLFSIVLMSIVFVPS